MDYDEFHARVVSRLDDVLEAKAGRRGQKRRLRSALGVGESFFGDLRRKKSRLPMDKVFHLLEILEIDAGLFLRSVADGAPITRLLPTRGHRDREDFAVADVVALANLHFEQGQSQEDRARGYWKYKVLEKMRSVNPKKAIELIVAAIPYVHRAWLPHLLGVYGTSLRLLRQNEQALQALHAGIRLAEDLSDLSILARIKQREAAVWKVLGEPDKAMSLTVEAGNLYELDSNPMRRGVCLVDQSAWFFAAGNADRALDSIRLALDLIPPEASEFFFTARLNNSYNFERLGDLERAWAWLDLANGHRGNMGRDFKASYLYQLGNLAQKRGKYRQSMYAFQELLQFALRRGMHLDAAEAALELCQVQLRCKQIDSVKETVLVSLPLIGLLKNHRIVATNIAEFFRSAISPGKLTIESLERAKKSVQAATFTGTLGLGVS